MAFDTGGGVAGSEAEAGLVSDMGEDATHLPALVESDFTEARGGADDFVCETPGNDGATGESPAPLRM